MSATFASAASALFNGLQRRLSGEAQLTQKRDGCDACGNDPCYTDQTETGMLSEGAGLVNQVAAP